MGKTRHSNGTDLVKFMCGERDDLLVLLIEPFDDDTVLPLKLKLLGTLPGQTVKLEVAETLYNPRSGYVLHKTGEVMIKNWKDLRVAKKY